MINISFKDDGNLGYTIQSDSNILGHRYDNCANQIQVTKPECEKESVCVMIVTHKDQIIKRVEILEKPVDVCNILSKFYEVEIGFTFKREDGYIKNTSKRKFEFLDAIKPDDFVLETPATTVDIDLLNSKAFVDCEVNEDNIVKFKNIQGMVAKEIKLENSSAPSDLTGYATTDYVDEIVVTTQNYVNEIVGDIDTALSNILGV